MVEVQDRFLVAPRAAGAALRTGDDRHLPAADGADGRPGAPRRGRCRVVILAGRVYQRSVLRFGTPLKLRQALKLVRT